MARLGLNHLSMQEEKYCPDMHHGKGDGYYGFETQYQSEQEDAVRARLIDSTLARGCDLFSQADAANLRDRLEYEDWHEEAPSSLASQAFMRGQRVRFGGCAYKLLDDNPEMEAATFTLLPRGLDFTPEQLMQADAPAIRNAFRSDLIRAGAMDTGGCVIAFIHGEYEPGTGVFRLHWHGLAMGGMIDVVSSLRDRRKYASTRKDDGSVEPVRQRVMLSRKPLTDLPYPLTYLLKSFWQCRWIGPVEDGTIKRQRAGQRIPEPYHTLALLWMDRWSLADIGLLMNVSVNSTGFRINRR